MHTPLHLVPPPLTATLPTYTSLFETRPLYIALTVLELRLALNSESSACLSALQAIKRVATMSSSFLPTIICVSVHIRARYRRGINQVPGARVTVLMRPRALWKSTEHSEPELFLQPYFAVLNKPKLSTPFGRAILQVTV